MPEDTRTLVSTYWLADHLHDPDVRILDGSWYLPSANRNCQAEFAAGHIPGAQFFDIDLIADTGTDLPHMVPPPEIFVSHVRAMGISNGHQVIVYDSAGLLSAARVWWLFRFMGHDDVAVLDGGLKKWRLENREVESFPTKPQERHFIARQQSHLIRHLDDIRKASIESNAIIIDARSSGRFYGTDPEPREGLPSGHIPGSLNIPFESVLNDDQTFRSRKELADVFTQNGLDLNSPIITTCGSGVTAAILSLALEYLGHRNHSLYDGSWAEWGNTHSDEPT